MIYTAIDTFYLTEEQLRNSPSRKDGIDEATETTLRIYGCDLIQECGILLRLPQAVMATGQVLLHRFYCKKSFGRFNVKRVAASCVWLASKLEESPRKARQVLLVFHRMECRRENLPIGHLDDRKYVDLKADLIRTERHLLKEMGFICHVEHPHKFISNYLVVLGTPAELRQEAWNLANDSLRTTLCVRFKSEVVACGVVYAAARRFQVPLPENPPWWKAFDADKAGINEVCRVLAHLYSQPKAEYIHVCKESGSFATTNRSWDSPNLPDPKDGGKKVNEDDNVANGSSSAVASLEVGKNDDVTTETDIIDKLKESKKSDDEMKPDRDSREGSESKPVLDQRAETAASGGERIKERDSRDRERQQERERSRGRDYERGRDEIDSSRDRERVKERSSHHRPRDKGRDTGRSEKSRHHSTSRDRDYYSSGYSSRDKERRRHHHSYA